MSTSIRRRVAVNTLAQLGGKAAVLALAAVSVVVLTRYLGTADYGRLGLALAYMQAFGVLADVGLFTTVVRDASRQPERTEELVGNAMALRLALCLVTILLGSAVSFLLPYDHDQRLAIALAGAPLALGLLNTSIVAVFNARLRMSRAVLAEVAGRALALALTVGVALLDLGFIAVIAAAAAGTGAALTLNWVWVRPLAKVRFRADLVVWRTLMRASLPVGIALAINEVYFRLDMLIISLYRPFEDVGLYTLAYRIMELTAAFGTAFLASTFPVLSRYVAARDSRLRQALQEIWDLVVCASVGVAAGGAIVAPGLVELAGGREFAGSGTPLQILLLAGGLAWINGVFGYALIAKERQLSALWLGLVALGLNATLNLLLVPEYGIVAAAWVTAGCEVVILVGSYLLMRRHFDFFPKPGALPAALVAAAVMSAALWPLRDGPVLMLVVLGALVYAGVLLTISPRARAAIRTLRAS